MSKDELIRLLSNGEDNFLERKSEGIAARELRKTAVGFANSVPDGREAVRFIAADDRNGQVLGPSDTDALQKRIQEALEVDYYPPIRYPSEIICVESKNIIAVVTPASSSKPTSCHCVHFERFVHAALQKTRIDLVHLVFSQIFRVVSTPTQSMSLSFLRRLSTSVCRLGRIDCIHCCPTSALSTEIAGVTR
jgi:predicted HTH transcriptional regulator